MEKKEEEHEKNTLEQKWMRWIAALIYTDEQTNKRPETNETS